jgi:cell wall-associated NlpC family hydrolase
MAFKLCGIPVMRDAAEQVTMGEEVHFLPEAQKGDIAFFDNAEGRIIHVGVLVDSQTIIHATDVAGRVVEDRIDGAGIISLSHKKRTHNLRAIRRILR